MAVLVIDDSVREEIKRVVVYAERHRMTIEDLQAITSGEKFPPGYSDEYCLKISDHYKVVYTQEYQPDDTLYHHLSVSVPGRLSGMIPSPEAVMSIMEEFEMGSDLNDCDDIWLEYNAVNVVKKIKR